MKKSLFNKFFSSKGFTLIELLIVIAILGVLAAGILVAIDPIDKINAANDAKVQNDISGAGRASEAYATTHNGLYPATLAELVAAGELKRVPVPPPPPSVYGSAYVVTMVPSPCNSGTSCTNIIITGSLKSKKYTSLGTPFWRYESVSGKSCAVSSILNFCP